MPLLEHLFKGGEITVLGCRQPYQALQTCSAAFRDVEGTGAHSLWPRALTISETSAVSAERAYDLRFFGLSESPYPRMSIATTCRPEMLCCSISLWHP